MLVCVRESSHPARVEPRLVGERVASRVRLTGVRREVGDLGHVMGCLAHQLERPVGETLGPHLHHEVRGQRDQVCVAGPLAVAVHDALHLEGAVLDRDQ
jgi:hypothetical protein